MFGIGNYHTEVFADTLNYLFPLKEKESFFFLVSHPSLRTVSSEAAWERHSETLGGSPSPLQPPTPEWTVIASTSAIEHGIISLRLLSALKLSIPPKPSSSLETGQCRAAEITGFPKSIVSQSKTMRFPKSAKNIKTGSWKMSCSVIQSMGLNRKSPNSCFP